MRHRLVGMAAALALALALAGCGATEITTELSTTELGLLVVESQPEDFWPEMAEETRGSEGFAPYLSDVYGLEPDTCVDGDLAYAASGVQAAELAVLRFATRADAETAEEALRDYLASRQAAFTGYAPGEAAPTRRRPGTPLRAPSPGRRYAPPPHPGPFPPRTRWAASPATRRGRRT